jgi:AcrR family transcriptional regulator
MSIPLSSKNWPSLDAAAKRERLLVAAAAVFSRDGLDASMPVVAAAAGAGVASVYRQFSSKYELLAALVIRRLEQIVEAATEATDRDGDRWAALTEMLRMLVLGQQCDDFMGEAHTAVAEHPGVIEATQRAMLALDGLLDVARAEGRLRADATTLDIRLLFAATRAAKHVEPEAWQRMLELLIDAFDAQRG